MTTLIHAAQPVRHVLRSTGVLALALGLTVVVLVALASVVETWA
ncbi:MAG: hypothetical protein NTX29_08000 [Actinobacteria bacterium]|nr:hypothetical protein [Actinomycetota bacterium]